MGTYTLCLPAVGAVEKDKLGKKVISLIPFPCHEVEMTEVTELTPFFKILFSFVFSFLSFVQYFNYSLVDSVFMSGIFFHITLCFS